MSDSDCGDLYDKARPEAEIEPSDYVETHGRFLKLICRNQPLYFKKSFTN